MRRLVCAIALVVLWAAPAAAHTGFDPDEAAPGSVVTVTLNAADERADAAIAKVELFPPDEVAVPFADPVAATSGWTGAVLADSVVWEGPPADGAQSFTITLGPLPVQTEGQRLQFRVLETYDNGEIDRWIEDYPIDGAEPEMPGPIIDLVPGGPGTLPEPTTIAQSPETTGAESLPVTTTVPESAPVEEEADDDGSSTLPAVLAVGAGIVAIAAVTFVLRRRRR